MIWTPEFGLILALVIPLIGGAAILAFGKAPKLREGATLVTAGLLLANIIPLVMVVGEGARPELTLANIAEGLSLTLRLEPLGAIFMAVAGSLWILNSLFSFGYMNGNNEKHKTRFYFFFAIAIASTMGVAMSGNMLTLFVFYEALTLSTYPLVAHKENETARRGARIYLMILLATSLGLLLPATVITYAVAGSTDFVLGGLLAQSPIGATLAGVLLFMFAFGIGKAALMPVHPWLPNAMVAPTPVSALLHAVAVVKAGVFTMLKVTVYLFGPEMVQSLPAGNWLAGIAAVSIVLASIIAMSKNNLKARLAYSTVSQLSYITLGAMLAAPAALIGAALQIVMHAFAKITLFMAAGAFYTATGKTEVTDTRGYGPYMPWLFGAFLAAALSITGIPPFGGAWPKLFLTLGALEAGQRWIVFALIASSILNVGYLVVIPARAFFSPIAEAPTREFRGAPKLTIIPLVLTATGACLLFFLVEPIYDYLMPIFGGGPTP